jgi:hypothetical protein
LSRGCLGARTKHSGTAPSATHQAPSRSSKGSRSRCEHHEDWPSTTSSFHVQRARCAVQYARFLRLSEPCRWPSVVRRPERPPSSAMFMIITVSSSLSNQGHVTLPMAIIRQALSGQWYGQSLQECSAFQTRGDYVDGMMLSIARL